MRSFGTTCPGVANLVSKDARDVKETSPEISARDVFVLKNYRKHKGPRHGIIHHRYVNYFVRLREGQPPKHYYPAPPTGYEKMEQYIKDKRDRKILLSL